MTHPMMRMIAAYPLPSALTSGCAAAPSWRSATPSMIAHTTTGNLALRHRGEGVREHVVHGDQQELAEPEPGGHAEQRPECDLPAAPIAIPQFPLLTPGEV